MSFGSSTPKPMSNVVSRPSRMTVLGAPSSPFAESKIWSPSRSPDWTVAWNIVGSKFSPVLLTIVTVKRTAWSYPSPPIDHSSGLKVSGFDTVTWRPSSKAHVSPNFALPLVTALSSAPSSASLAASTVSVTVTVTVSVAGVAASPAGAVTVTVAVGRLSPAAGSSATVPPVPPQAVSSTTACSRASHIGCLFMYFSPRVGHEPLARGVRSALCPFPPTTLTEGIHAAETWPEHAYEQELRPRFPYTGPVCVLGGAQGSGEQRAGQ